MPNKDSVTKRAALALIGLLLGLAGLAHIGYGCLLTWRGEVASSAAAIGIGLVLVLFATLDRFEAVKGLGVEARLRKVDDKINEADRVLAQVRKLAELTGAELVGTAAKIGRFDSAPTPEKLYELANAVRALLNESGSPRQVVMSALEPWTRVMGFELCHRLFGVLRARLKTVESQLRDEMNALDNSQPGHNERYSAIFRRVSAVSQAAGQNRLIGTLHADQIRGWLREQIRSAPELNDDERRDILSELGEWDEAIRVLVSEADLDNPKRWFAKLEEPFQ